MDQEGGRRSVLVTGATGYIGGRLVPRLLEAGFSVRCLVRDPRKLESRSWITHPEVTVVTGDVGDTDRLARHMKGCEAAYYLVHSMMVAGKEYRDEDRRLAQSFADAAAGSSLTRIIYLGGLGETGEGLSEHLFSRREVEAALSSGSVPVTVLRAAMIIGSGSASFEILRYLVERLPIMITPKWVSTEAQPISVADALHYLVRCLDVPETTGKTLDIGGPDILSYRELMKIMAETLELRARPIIPVPVLSPKLSSFWIHIITPVSHRIAQPLALGLQNRVVCRNEEAVRLMPRERLTVRESIAAAVGRRDQDVETSWTDAGPIPGDPDWAGGKTFEDVRSIAVAAPMEAVFQTVCRIGGEHGWFAADPLWKLRGALDRMVGGPGIGRGRRRLSLLQYGDVLDFWRVAGLEPGRRLLLRAEMKLPGEALLEFHVDPDPDSNGQSRLTQIARFKPKGLLGLAYWLAVLPLHNFVFKGMLEGIRQKATT